MGDLARRRNARDLWISRSHLWALGAGVAVLGITTFLLGISLGRAEAGRMDDAPRTLVAEVPDDALVELLARVEASADPLGGIDLLTFPGELSRVIEPIVAVGPPLPADLVPLLLQPPPPVVADAPELLEVDAGAVAMTPIADTRPPGAFTVQVLVLEGPDGAAEAVGMRNDLRKNGLDAWVASELVSGTPRYRVSVGGYGAEAEAVAAVAAVHEKTPGLTPTVVPSR